MRAVVQRVRWGRVSVGGEVVGAIERGVVVLLGVAQGDGEAQGALLARKIAGLRIFPAVTGAGDGDGTGAGEGEEDGKMDRSLIEIGGAALVVSQFTLFADCRKGRRPFFGGAEAPARADALCEHFAGELRAQGVTVETGRFGAMMQVELCNDGPVTIPLDTRDLEGPRRGAS